MAQDDLVAFLVSLRQSFRDGGALLMITASFLEESLSQRISLSGKDAVKWLQDKVGLRSRGQFWDGCVHERNIKPFRERLGCLP